MIQWLCLVMPRNLIMHPNFAVLRDILRKVVRSKNKLGAKFGNNLTKYEVFSFQPIGALELRSMTSELKIQVPY